MYDATRLSNALTLAVRKEISRYYSATLQCDEPSCSETSRGLSTHIARDEAGLPLFPACTVPRCKGRMCKSVPDRTLHTQLLYYKSLFDLPWSKTKVEQDNKRRAEKLSITSPSPAEEDLFRQMTAKADQELSRSAFHAVDFSSLFAQPSAPAGGSSA